MKTLKLSTLALALGSLSFGVAAEGISDDVIRIGFVTDMSGVYSDYDGKKGVEAIKLAIEDFGGEINGKRIELLTADHQNKADIASARARDWFDSEKLDVLIGGTNSAANLAMSSVANDKKKLFISAGAGASGLINEHCNRIPSCGRTLPARLPRARGLLSWKTAGVAGSLLPRTTPMAICLKKRL